MSASNHTNESLRHHHRALHTDCDTPATVLAGIASSGRRGARSENPSDQGDGATRVRTIGRILSGVSVVAVLAGLALVGGASAQGTPTGVSTNGVTAHA